MTVVVFLGPSLPRAEAEAILTADYRPPVRQGDVYRLMSQGKPQGIAVIDGYFQEVPSVWHKEILWAIDQGVPVYGAASMGALRAAELARFGMIGVGKIFEAYQRGSYAPFESEPFEDDDEVAVIHGPAELSFPPLSDAMVDLRETLAAAAREGIIEASLRDALVDTLKKRFYRDRSFDALAALLTDLNVDQDIAKGLVAWLPGGRTSQKQADARALLELLAVQGPGLPAERERFTFERTTLWAQFVEQSEDPSAVVSEDERRVLDELRLDPGLYGSYRNQAALRLQLHADSPLPAADHEARRAALDRLRRRHGLWSRKDLDAWVADCDLTRASLDRLLAYEAALEEAIQSAGASMDTALLDVLRSAGEYAALAERARDKQRRLKEGNLLGIAPSALSSPGLLDWYFEVNLGRVVPEDVALYASENGFAELRDFLVAIERERRYRMLCKVPSEGVGEDRVAAAGDDC